MIEKTFAFIKPHDPDNMELGADEYFAGILSLIESAGFTVLHSDMRVLGRKKLAEHYEAHKGRDFFRPMLDYLTSDESFLLILEHPDEAVNRLRELAGPTDPKKGSPGQIRHAFGVHGEDLFRNAIHASETPVDARIEVGRFFGGIDLDAPIAPVNTKDYQALPT